MQVNKCIVDPDGRYILLDTAINNYRLSIANIYAPNGDEPGFYAQLFKSIQQLDNCEVIIGGDFNLVIDSQLD